jgi:ATP-dependent DNA helicase RecG
LPKVRQIAVNRNPNHPWLKMSDFELFRSCGLYDEDFIIGVKGFNMAAVLLFGKDEVIKSCVPGYVTDAIYRVENLERYDDRLMVDTNLIESYDLLVEFIAKHTSDKFFLIEGVNTSIRNLISRELIGNILTHREFSSAFPAKIIIESNQIVMENWNKPLSHTRIYPDSFTPFPKNPLLARFFVNLGLADTLGSGVRNLFKYTKLYSGGEPILIEDDVFKTTVPLKETVAVKKYEKIKKYKTYNSPESIQEKVQESIQESIQEKVQESIQESIQEKVQERIQESIQEKVQKSIQESGFSKTQIEILKQIKLDSKITQRVLALKLNIPFGTIKKNIRALQQAKVLFHEGATKQGVWIIKRLTTKLK